MARAGQGIPAAPMQVCLRRSRYGLPLS